MTLTELGIIIGCELKSMQLDNGKRVAVWLDGVVIKRESMIVSAYGDSSTLHKAKHDYAVQLRGKKIVVDPLKESRREFQLPPIITGR